MNKEEHDSLIKNLITQLQLTLSLIKQEAKLAFNCFETILTLLIFRLILIFSIWMLAFVLVGYGFYVLTNNALLSLILILVLNLSAYLLISLLEKYLWSNMFFKSTRKQFKLEVNKHAV